MNNILVFLRTRIEWIGSALMWLHLVRVPVILSGVATVLPALVLTNSNGSTLVRGAFEAGPPGFGCILLAVLFLFFTCLECTRIVLLYGCLRFGLNETMAGVRPIIKVLCAVWYSLAPALTIWGCWTLRLEPTTITAYLLYGAGGIIISLAGFFCARRATASWLPANLLQRLTNAFRFLGTGYVTNTGHIAQGHMRGLFFAVFSTVVFLGGGLLNRSGMPSILFVLMLLMALTWIFSSLTFYLDRFRIPLILIVLLWLSSVSLWWRKEDYTFKTVPIPSGHAELPSAGHILSIPADKSEPKQLVTKPVCVAAVGGGIHSGAWAVEVLTRLEQIAGEGLLSNHIRALSGTSGGAYGLMHYAFQTYPYGKSTSEAKRKNLREITQRSSLGPVVGALVYNDLLEYAIPSQFLPTAWRIDRGQSMEDAWLRNLGNQEQEDELRKETMADWANRAWERHFPAVLFTSGTEESGRPIVFGNSAVWDWNFNAPRSGQATKPHGNYTVPVTTGARLSATFPWISPAAVPDMETGENKLLRREHQLDGGYYDNYGIAALNRWMQEGLDAIYPGEGKAQGRILVIQIRYANDDATNEPETAPPGFLNQTLAPIKGIYQARVAGQRLRADEYFAAFCKYWQSRGLQIENASFQFSATDKATGLAKPPAPLSWHLTVEDKRDLDEVGSSIEAQLKYCDEWHANNRPPDSSASKEAQESYQAAILKLNSENPLGASARVARDFLKADSSSISNK